VFVGGERAWRPGVALGLRCSSRRWTAGVHGPEGLRNGCRLTNEGGRSPTSDSGTSVSSPMATVLPIPDSVHAARSQSRERFGARRSQPEGTTGEGNEEVMTAENHHTVISLMLAVPDAPAAVEWYKAALGATELWNLGGVAVWRSGERPSSCTNR